jgi:hypothetical protein
MTIIMPPICTLQSTTRPTTQAGITVLVTTVLVLIPVPILVLILILVPYFNSHLVTYGSTHYRLLLLTWLLLQQFLLQLLTFLLILLRAIPLAVVSAS